MKFFFRFMIQLTLWSVLLLSTWVLRNFYRAQMPPVSQAPGAATARWLPKNTMDDQKLNHLILSGNAYGRGLRAGEETKGLLYEQELSLYENLKSFFPSYVLQWLLESIAIELFWDTHKLIDQEHLQEMAGVARSASTEFNRLGDPYLRQLGYHAIHEVGQIMVDQGFPAMACTVVALKTKNSWVVGRNFDFEAGRIFDEEKILKWVFPEKGFAFVSVIWAGMVGAVTGVNEKGVYISLNAGGSSELSREGVPSTLLLLKALQNSGTANEAVEVLKKYPMLITDIFAVADREGNFFRVEKSPVATEAERQENSLVIANHLENARWRQDKINLYRQSELTTVQRSDRGRKLVEGLSVNMSAEQALHAVLSILRDKGGEAVKAVGQRSAIDALIATHSVLYDAENFHLYVSTGPSLVGVFEGFDLEASFAKRQPLKVSELPADLDVLDSSTYTQIKREYRFYHSQLWRKDCKAASDGLALVHHTTESPEYYDFRANMEKHCNKSETAAIASWKKALAAKPAYRRDRLRIEKALHELEGNPK